mmetsp:Transcript_32086/g.91537  ORF Transcript_32086/g.91537 Transcript_32086/m.91537 type:complete len:162 (+) Transcript_32086:73-558(+)
MGGAACVACFATSDQCGQCGHSATETVFYSAHTELMECQRPAAGKMIKVLVDRSFGQDLGLDVDIDCGSLLLVVAIKDGAISEWNETCRGQCIRPGDSLVAVNGRRGHADDLLLRCRAEGPLELTFQSQEPWPKGFSGFEDEDVEGESTGSSLGPVPLDSL